MPGIDGLQFLKEITKIKGLKIPVIVLSTSSQPETISSAKENGADGYLTKPNSIKKFVQFLTLISFRQTDSLFSLNYPVFNATLPLTYNYINPECYPIKLVKTYNVILYRK